ncbi:hypothetical protein EDB89DRAFT_1904845 [Lactarius sanguifluus]|nr:hypothetical protein EDB89DRAFT_1904845 [Lactarius sanguifluus]
MTQISERATAIEARPKIAGKRGARQTLAWVLFTTLSQTQRDLDTDRLNAQKARELPRGRPLPAGQARRVYAICERGGDTASESALLQHSTALQEELAAQLAQMAGQPCDHREKALGTTCLTISSVVVAIALWTFFVI